MQPKFWPSRELVTCVAAMRNQFPVQTARERNRMLRDIATEKKLAFMQSFIGKTVEAITLHSSRDVMSSAVDEFPPDYTESLTDNYLKLRLKGRHEANQWVTVKVESVENGTLVGISSAAQKAHTPRGRAALQRRV